MTLYKPTANNLLYMAPNLCDISHISVLFKEVTTVVFQTSYAYRNTLLSPNFTVRTGQCCTVLLILTAFPQNNIAWSKNITCHSLVPFHLIKSSCVILFWTFFTFWTSHFLKLHKVQLHIKFTQFRWNLRYPKLQRWQSSKKWHCVVWIIATIYQITLHYSTKGVNLNWIQLPKNKKKKKKGGV
jgi:hypothetical protein